MCGHPNFLPNMHRNTLTFAHSRLHARTLTLTRTHAPGHTHTHTHTHTYIHTYIHTHTHNTLAHSHSHSHHTHTHTHTHTNKSLPTQTIQCGDNHTKFLLGPTFCKCTTHTQTLRAHNMSCNVVELWKSATCSVSYSSIAYMIVYSYFILTTLKNTVLNLGDSLILYHDNDSAFHYNW